MKRIDFGPLIRMMIAGLSAPYVDFVRRLEADGRITRQEVEALDASVLSAADALDAPVVEEVRRLLASAGFDGDLERS
jgi:hypothetical protein